MTLDGFSLSLSLSLPSKSQDDSPEKRKRPKSTQFSNSRLRHLTAFFSSTVPRAHVSQSSLGSYGSRRFSCTASSHRKADFSTLYSILHLNTHATTRHDKQLFPLFFVLLAMNCVCVCVSLAISFILPIGPLPSFLRMVLPFPPPVGTILPIIPTKTRFKISMNPNFPTPALNNPPFFPRKIKKKIKNKEAYPPSGILLLLAILKKKKLNA